MNTFWEVILLIAVVMTVFVMAEKVARKKLNIPRKDGFFYYRVNKFHARIDMALLALFFILIWFVEEIYIVIVFLLIVQSLVRAYFEWKIERERREYIITLGSMGLFFIVMLVLFVFDIINF